MNEWIVKPSLEISESRFGKNVILCICRWEKKNISSSIIAFCIATYAATVFQCAGLAQQQCSTQPSGQKHLRCGKKNHTCCDACSTRSVLAGSRVRKKKLPFRAVEWNVGLMPPSVTLSLHFTRATVFLGPIFTTSNTSICYYLDLKPCAWSHTLDLHPGWTKRNHKVCL